MDGWQGKDVKTQTDLYALAVRPGEVSVVPVPGTLLLLASGLGALGAFGKGIGFPPCEDGAHTLWNKKAKPQPCSCLIDAGGRASNP